MAYLAVADVIALDGGLNHLCVYNHSGARIELAAFGTEAACSDVSGFGGNQRQ